jgi:sterol desaturase/sphingolipid hydroxylase (fatty acid hydroxylase superfamily)
VKLTPRRVAWIHHLLAGVWALLLIPTLLLWKNSVLWVAAMSLYANFVGHLSAAKASRAEQEAEKQ